MKFTAFVTLAIFAVLVHQGESTLEDAINGLPTAVADLLADFSAGPHNYTKGESYYGTQLDVKFTSAANPEADEESTTYKTYGNSVAAVSFNMTIPDLTLTGNLTLKESSYPYQKHQANFTTLSLGGVTMKFRVYYAFRTNSVIVQSEVKATPMTFATDFAWEEGIVESSTVTDAQNKLDSILSDTFADDLAEYLHAVARGKKSDLLLKLGDLYKRL